MYSNLAPLLALPFFLTHLALQVSAEPEVLRPLPSWDEQAVWGKRALGYGDRLKLREKEHLMWGNPKSMLPSNFKFHELIPNRYIHIYVRKYDSIYREQRTSNINGEIQISS